MTYLAGRLVLFALTLLLISVVTFAVTHILPGDVATMIMGTRGNPTSIAALQQKLGLNDPLIEQYARWIGGLLSGEWGVSLRFKEPIATLIAQKLMASGMIVVHVAHDRARARDSARRLERDPPRSLAGHAGHRRSARRDQPAGFFLGHPADPLVLALAGLAAIVRLRVAFRRFLARRCSMRCCPRSRLG